MLFSSYMFVLWFLPATILIYYIIPRRYRGIRNTFLFIASIVFYGWGEPSFVLLMLSTIIANYCFALCVDKYRKKVILNKVLLILMLSYNLGVLFIFKYLFFFLNNLEKIFQNNFAIPPIILPIGISFFTFQSISYVIDVYRGRTDGSELKAQKNIINVGLYIALFPQLVAGPIVRYSTIADQINNRKENIDNFGEGVKRFIVGLSKKQLFANTFGLIADKAFTMPTTDLSTTFSWLGAIAYSMQIFYDFSGYSDMAIGLGKIFGFHFLENFNYPYISKSVSEFWRRWHISLGSWFRDYLYFPLGGSRKGLTRTIFNLAIVWFLTGFWHGANWTFVIWGMLFFLCIATEKIIYIKLKRQPGFLFGNAYTLLVVMFGWVLFRADNLSHSLKYIQVMLSIGENVWNNALTMLYIRENIYFLLLGILFCFPMGRFFKEKITRRIKCFSEGKKILFEFIYAFTYIAIFIVTLSYLVKGGYNPFIYFNF